MRPDDAADTAAFIVVHHVRGTMTSRTASTVAVRDFSILADEPVEREGTNKGPTPLELVLVSLCAGINIATGRVAHQIGFVYSSLQVSARGELDTRRRLGMSSEAPLHYRSIEVGVEVGTVEPIHQVERVAELVDGTSAVVSLVRAAVPDYRAKWERV